MKSWVVATGQRWKLIGFYALMLVSVSSFVLLILAVNDHAIARPFGEVRAGLMLMASGAAAMVWLCWSVRCHQCDGRPAWYLVRTAPISRWYIALVTSPKCPACGYEPRPEGDHQT